MKKHRRETAAAVTSAFLAAVLVSMLVLAFREYRSLIIREQEERMMTIAKAVSNSISVYVDFYFTDLREVDHNPGYHEAARRSLEWGDGEKLQKFLKEHMELQNEDVENLLLISGYKENGKYELKAQVRSGRIYETVNSLAGKNEGTRIDILEDQEGQFYLGLSISTLQAHLEKYRLMYVLHIERMYQKVGSYIRVGEHGYVMIKDSTGRILMHPVKEQIGADVIDDRKKKYPNYDFSDLEQLISHQLEGREDVEIYNSYWWADEPPRQVRKIGAYTPLRFQDDFLIICAVMDYNEIADPINHGMMTISVLSLALMAIFAALFYGLWTAAKEKRRIEQENRYLRCVNSKLEELRQQEERISHDQRLRVIGNLTSGIAHEFRNILTPIMGYAGMIMEMSEECPEAADSAREIYDSAERGAELIRQISLLSRKQADKKAEPLLVCQEMEKIHKTIETICPKGITVKIKQEWQEDCRILCSETEFHQIILNLCTNAFDAMKGNEGILYLEGGMREGNVMISVKDTGCGMSKETVEHMFEPFFTTKKTGEGTGLGLPMVQGILESLGGRITVESVLGEGSCFTIYIPEYRSKSV